VKIDSRFYSSPDIRWFLLNTRKNFIHNFGSKHYHIEINPIENKYPMTRVVTSGTKGKMLIKLYLNKKYLNSLTHSYLKFVLNEVFKNTLQSHF
jgi:hypothetical protein